jgi:beta-lactamase regulating signal transducer with metallopeptidase domain/Leucine-rich repeat (LRR) protein
MNAALDLARIQLWQVTAAIGLVAIVTRLFCGRRPHLAYLLWMLVIVKALLPPVMSSPTSPFSWLAATRESSAVATVSPPVRLPPLVEQPVPIVDRALMIETPRSEPSASPIGKSHVITPRAFNAGDWLAIVWFAGFLATFLIFAFRQFRWHQTIRRTSRPVDLQWQSLTGDLCQRLGYSGTPRLLVTDQPLGPAVFGWWRPIIVLPRALMANEDRGLIEPILAHELVHLRRRDPLAAMLQLAAALVWWFHPLVWWANREARRQRERACDEEVIAGLNCSAAGYGRGLLTVLELRLTSRTAAGLVGMHGRDITAQRLKHLLSGQPHFHRRTPRWCWAITGLAALAILPGAGLALSAESDEVNATPVVEADGGDVQSSTVGSKWSDEERAIIEQIESHGGRVFLVEKQQPNYPSVPYANALLDAAWKGSVDDLKRLSAFKRLRQLHLQADRVKPEELVELRSIPQLERLMVVDCPAAGFKTLGELVQLTSLTIHANRSGLSTAELQGLSRLVKLWNLNLVAKQLPEGGLSVIANFAQLKKLSLMASENSATDAAWLAPLINLEELFVSGLTLSDKAGQRLGELPRLETLTLNQTKIGELAFTRCVKNTGLRILWVMNDGLSPSSISAIGELTNLSILELSDAGVTDAEIANWSGLKSLRLLSLPKSKIGDAGLTSLAQLTDLRSLSLTGSNTISDKGMSELAKLPMLRSLSLGGENTFTEAGLEGLLNLHRLTQLSLSAPRLTDRSAGKIAALARLESLSLSNTQVTDAGLAPFATLASLNNLSLTASPCTGTGFEKLKNLEKLTDLRLRDCKINGAGLAVIATLPALKNLDLSGTPIDDAALAALAACKTLEDVRLSNTAITDAGILHLAELPKLQTLIVQHSKVTPEGFKQMPQYPSWVAQPLGFSLIDLRTRADDEDDQPVDGAPQADAAPNNDALKKNQEPQSELPPFFADAIARSPNRVIDLGHKPVRIDGHEYGKATIAGFEADLLSAMSKYWRGWKLDWISLNNGGASHDPLMVKITDEWLDRLGTIRLLKVLEGANDLTDKGLAQLATMTELQTLSIGGTFTPAGLKNLATLPHLRNLRLNAPIDDERLKTLAQITTLESLFVGGDQITDAGLASLAGLSDLKHLQVNSSAITDAGVAQLAPLKKLKSLSLDSPKFTGSSLALLREAPLSYLQLAYTALNDAGLVNLRFFPQLTTVVANDTQITDDSLPVLGELKELEHLDLMYTAIRGEGLATVTSLPKLNWLNLRRTEIDDQHLEPLKNLKAPQKDPRQLTLLDISETRITAAGSDLLKQALPDARVTWLPRTPDASGTIRLRTSFVPPQEPAIRAFSN